jgi:hypothetical protein
MTPVLLLQKRAASLKVPNRGEIMSIVVYLMHFLELQTFIHNACMRKLKNLIDKKQFQTYSNAFGAA